MQRNLDAWFKTPQGSYVLQWETGKFNLLVNDIFGYNAVQLGLAACRFLENSRVSYHCYCTAQGQDADVCAAGVALPFEASCIDLILMPHVLEFSENPHQVLREVERVLVPEGKVIITGFNPYSLWGVRRKTGLGKCYAPAGGTYLSRLRLKDWLSLLGFEVQSGSFGCYIPPVKSEKWVERWKFMDKAGDRWWPVCGAVYMILAVKRVAGMRLITPSWQSGGRKKAAAAAVIQRKSD